MTGVLRYVPVFSQRFQQQVAERPGSIAIEAFGVLNPSIAHYRAPPPLPVQGHRSASFTGLARRFEAAWLTNAASFSTSRFVRASTAETIESEKPCAFNRSPESLCPFARRHADGHHFFFYSGNCCCNAIAVEIIRLSRLICLPAWASRAILTARSNACIVAAHLVRSAENANSRGLGFNGLKSTKWTNGGQAKHVAHVQAKKSLAVRGPWNIGTIFTFFVGRVEP
jgi:hypothetical protein